MDLVNRGWRGIALMLAAAVSCICALLGLAVTTAYAGNCLKFKAEIVVHNRSNYSLVLDPRETYSKSLVFSSESLNLGWFSAHHSAPQVINPGEHKTIKALGYGPDGLDAKVNYFSENGAENQVDISVRVRKDKGDNALTAWQYGVFDGRSTARYSDRLVEADVSVTSSG